MNNLQIRLIVTILLLGPGTGLVHADRVTELAAAKAAFEKLQNGLSARVNKLDEPSRAAIWTQYYLALERLQRMDVHQQMMSRHKQDRAVQFEQARAEFNRAVDELRRLLPAAPEAIQSE